MHSPAATGQRHLGEGCRVAAIGAGPGGSTSMIIVDRALQERERTGQPLRVGMIGAGAMGRAITNQIVNAVPGMRLVAIANRHPDAGRRAFAEAGIEEVVAVDSVTALERAIDAGRPAITDDPSLLCAAGPIDALIAVTRTIDFAPGVVLDGLALRNDT